MMINPKQIAHLITEDPDIPDEYAGLEDNDEFDNAKDISCAGCTYWPPEYERELQHRCCCGQRSTHPSSVCPEIDLTRYDYAVCANCGYDWCPDCFGHNYDPNNLNTNVCRQCSTITEDVDEYAGLEDNDEFGGGCSYCNQPLDTEAQLCQDCGVQLSTQYCSECATIFRVSYGGDADGAHNWNTSSIRNFCNQCAKTRSLARRARRTNLEENIGEYDGLEDNDEFESEEEFLACWCGNEYNNVEGRAWDHVTHCDNCDTIWCHHCVDSSEPPPSLSGDARNWKFEIDEETVGRELVRCPQCFLHERLRVSELDRGQYD